MAMIEEAYVSFEVAKLLKEKGFNEQCSSTYDIAVSGGKPIFFKYDVLKFFPHGMKNSDDKYGMVISAPTHQMAMAWLREIYGIDILIEITDPKNRKYYCMIWDGNDNSYIIDLFNSYEEAVEAAIKYCLEIIIK